MYYILLMYCCTLYIQLGCYQNNNLLGKECSKYYLNSICIDWEKLNILYIDHYWDNIHSHMFYKVHWHNNYNMSDNSYRSYWQSNICHNTENNYLQVYSYNNSEDMNCIYIEDQQNILYYMLSKKKNLSKLNNY